MFINDLNMVDNKLYKNSIPKYLKDNYSYFRQEKDDYYTFTSKAYASEELLLNQTVLIFLEECDGKKTIDQIEKNIILQFPEVSRNEIHEDLMGVLRMMNMLGLVKWLKGANPFMNLCKNKIGENVSIGYADENDLNNISLFYKNFNYDDSYVIFNDYSRDFKNETNIVNLRYKLFSFTNEIFVLKVSDRIIGVVDISLPDGNKSTVAEIISLLIPKEYVNETIKYINERIAANSVFDITKISISALDNQENNSIEEILLSNEYIEEAKLTKQINNSDVKIISKII